MRQQRTERDVLVMARSRMSSSALGALSQSTRLAVGNSLPMMGVTSKDSYESRDPDNCSGVVLFSFELMLIGVSSRAEGDML